MLSSYTPIISNEAHERSKHGCGVLAVQISEKQRPATSLTTGQHLSWAAFVPLSFPAEMALCMFRGQAPHEYWCNVDNTLSIGVDRRLPSEYLLPVRSRKKLHHQAYPLPGYIWGLCNPTAASGLNISWDVFTAFSFVDVVLVLFIIVKVVRVLGYILFVLLIRTSKCVPGCPDE